MKVEQSILKQKTRLQWFKERVANSKYFLALIRGRRKRLFINQVMYEYNVWVQGDDNIAQAACAHFEKIFICENKKIDEEILNVIPKIITRECNQLLKAFLFMEELHQVVFHES